MHFLNAFLSDFFASKLRFCETDPNEMEKQKSSFGNAKGLVIEFIIVQWFHIHHAVFTWSHVSCRASVCNP